MERRYEDDDDDTDEANVPLSTLSGLETSGPVALGSENVITTS